MSSFDIIPREFYDRSTEMVARELLGAWLIRASPKGISGGVIVETEAYLGHIDPASHSFRGQTRRNAAMFGPPGHAYVYFIYGNHFCFNTVCGHVGTGEAVLIRAVEPAFDIEGMRKKRGGVETRQISNGPGKLCSALGIDRSLDGADLCQPGSPIFIAQNPSLKLFFKASGPVKASVRVGITKAAEAPLRFYLAKNPFVSRLEREPKI
jgi:DNA-3-methyladenine glycosylase